MIRKKLITSKFIKSHPNINDNNAKNRKWNWENNLCLGENVWREVPQQTESYCRAITVEA